MQPVIEYLKTLNDTDVNRKRIKRCEKLNTLYFETGIDNEGLTTLAKAACVVLRVMDASKAVWETFGDVNAKRHELILYAHNNHFKHILAAEVKNINTNIFTKDQEVEWVKPDFNYAELNRQFLEAQQIESKGKQVAQITPTLIYKSEFNECEKFPNQFTDGGVGKAKFLEQNPHLSDGLSQDDLFRHIYFNADVSGFYSQRGKSHTDNIKLDHNKSYASFKKSPAGFKGFPLIDSVFTINTKVSDIDLSHYCGLLYVDVKTLTKFDLDKPIYYESSNWYPIEIVYYYFKQYNINPTILYFANATTTFDCDFSKFTNDQFRCFVGKTACKHSTATWKTTDKYEYMRALYQLSTQIKSVKEYKVDKATIFEVEYIEPDKTP